MNRNLKIFLISSITAGTLSVAAISFFNRYPTGAIAGTITGLISGLVCTFIFGIMHKHYVMKSSIPDSSPSLGVYHRRMMTTSITYDALFELSLQAAAVLGKSSINKWTDSMGRLS